ncbi:hypothetical protein T4B_15488 [Trichinella pseudospiralis]|uniref:Uncharacterized protein n=2 Tax=Trichinella pseudospiralis TaxID=6337 RepID=A0A0V1FRF3_TRIPS|nr:hypothetical protein T4A_11104 [Trichinella pseudospiralis]KRY88385.1 hypothetical protein T4D_4584 [Trichinella pseudospiralis]KRZ26247.1 hypothetical protein T4B_15488 [Trichinella pseudospiralis]KRZ35424.1 hypothetical protein T4C_3875 [Trichinella pseudospiralis]
MSFLAVSAQFHLQNAALVKLPYLAMAKLLFVGLCFIIKNGFDARWCLKVNEVSFQVLLSSEALTLRWRRGSGI